MRLVGLYREAECSPGRHRSNDTLLLEQIAAALRRDGVQVDLTTLDPSGAPADAAVIFSMCQGPAALDVLRRWERAGASIVNSPAAARNTYRDRLPGLLQRAGVSFPATRVVDTRLAGDPALPLDGGVWLKRGDVHASVSADVQRVESRAALAAGLAGFASRGIGTAAVQAHVDGDELKFYGVRGSGFFHWFHSGATRDRRVDASALQRLAGEAASAVGLDVYGGDVIVGDDGGLTLIDLNDWPSFAPCREAASNAIAGILKRRAHAVWDGRGIPRANQSAV